MHRPEQNTKHTLLGNSAWIFLIRFFPALAAVLMIFWFSRHFDAGFYGFYQGFWVQLQLINAIACIGIPALLLTYPQSWIHDFLRKTPGRIIALCICWMIGCAGVFTCFQFSQSSCYFNVFTFFFLLVNIVTAVVEGYLMAGKEFKLLSVANGIYAAFFIVIHWLFVKELILLQTLFNALLAGCLLKLIILLIPAASLFRSFTNTDNGSASFKTMGSLWFHLGLYDIIQVLFRWGDKFVLSFLLSKELFAVYFNGTIEIPFLALLLGAVGSALLLQMNKSDATETDRIQLLKKSSSKLSLIVFPLFLFFVLFRHELFEVVFTHRYAAAVPLFLINCFIIPLRCYNFTSILQNKGKGRIINTGAALDLIVALVLIYPLYLIWQLKGVALTFIISTYVQAGFYLWQTAKVMQCSILDLMPLKQWLRNAIVFSIGFIALYYTSSYFLNPYNTLLLGGSATLVILFFNLMTVFLKKRI